MKQEDLLKSLSYVDEDLLERADQQHKRKKHFLKNWVAIAACIALLIGIGTKVMNGREKTMTKLSMLTITSNNEGMGFEGYLAYDIDELENGNPWNEDLEITTLPVYENLSYYSAAGVPVYNGDEKDLLELAEQTAKELNMDIKNVVYQRDESESGKIYGVEVETDLGSISVEGDGCISIFYDEGLTLPEEYRFDGTFASRKDAEQTLKYLLQQYSDLISFEQPKCAIFADYSFDGNRNPSYYAYDEKGTIENKILNYNFNYAQFCSNEAGNLYIVRMNNGLSNVKKLGDYPIITKDQATELLLNHNYITSVPEEMPGKEYIKKAELAYRTSNLNEMFMPYYRFYVELPSEEVENGLKNFGMYYVPAVDQEYIKNMPVWDGSFN